MLESCKDTLQENLREAIQKVPVEPLKAPPKIVQPFPGGRARHLLMPPLQAPVRLSFRLNRVAKMRTGLPQPKRSDVGCYHYNSTGDHTQADTRGHKISHFLSLDNPPSIKLQDNRPIRLKKKFYQSEKQVLYQAERKELY